VLVLGPSRSGKTAALRRIATAWRQVHPLGRIVVVQPRGPHRPAALQLAALADEVVTDTERIAEAIEDGSRDAPSRDTLLLVDDAELTDDPTGALTALIRRRGGDLLVVAAAKPDALRQSYGHWTSVIRRSRLGIVAAAGGELDGDLLGVTLPRRLPTSARPGLAWLVDNGVVTLCQIAVDAAQCGAVTRASSGGLHFAASL
jgi:S-DNA-T family DNA segregation ATPase FtsK/SpoIIIE